MKRPVKIILAAIAFIILGALVWWQFNKKRIVRNAVENVISKKTDSLYFIHYDSSAIDAIAGNASFYNVTLQSDSLQKQLLQYDSSSASSIYNISVGEIAVSGANIPALISNQKVEASSIRLIRPVIYIINSGTKKEKPFSREDTLAVYEKLLGKFKSIKAGEVVIKEGQINFSKKIDDPYLSLNDINISLRNVLIDSTKNYDNIISYFIKDVNASVGKTVLKNDSVTATFSNVVYDAAKRNIKLGNFRQENESGKIIFDVNNTTLTGLNTDAFILNREIKADELTTDGGLMTFYRKQATAKKTATDEEEGIEIDNNFFDDALVNKISLGNTKVLIYNKIKPNEAPLEINNLKFNASDIQTLSSGTNLRSLIGKSNWTMSADGFSYITKDKNYKIQIGAFDISKATGHMHVNSFAVIPVFSKEVFAKKEKVQTDLYDFKINNIDISGIDTKKLFEEKRLLAETASFEPIIKDFCDRTVPPNPASKVGNYPHELIQKVKFPFAVKKVFIKKGYVAYTEKSAITAQNGVVFFTNVNATIDNMTNIKELIAKNNLMVLNINTQFMGVGNLQTKWTLPLNTTNGEFRITAYLGPFNGQVLSPLSEPLALVGIKNADIKSLNLNMYGTDLKGEGSATLLYNDLKVTALKDDDGNFKKKGLLSGLANFLIINDNPKNKETRKGNINLKRDATRSFFNLVWKGIFGGVKRIALGKNDEK